MCYWILLSVQFKPTEAEKQVIQLLHRGILAGIEDDEDENNGGGSSQFCYFVEIEMDLVSCQYYIIINFSVFSCSPKM